MVIEKDAERTATSPLPYLGRSVRIVGDWKSVDASETPHEKNKRGELGKGEQLLLDSVGSPGSETQGQALDRAYSAAILERSTAQLNDRLIAGAPPEADSGRLVAEAGGIPIGRPYVIAGVGVSGGTPEQNHECARAALVPR